jgi:hypothetical protein
MALCPTLEIAPIQPETGHLPVNFCDNEPALGLSTKLTSPLELTRLWKASPLEFRCLLGRRIWLSDTQEPWSGKGLLFIGCSFVDANHQTTKTEPR